MAHVAPGTLVIGLFVLPVHLALGQEPGAVRVRVEAPLRLSVASNVDQSCRPEVQPEPLQSRAEARLRDAGFTVSNIHNAQLTSDADCIAVAPAPRNASVAVHECLSMSEVMASPAKQGRATLAATWRKCQSFTCTRAKCDAAAESALDGLLANFLTDFKSPAALAVTYLEQPLRHEDNRGPVVLYFSVYMVFCLTVFCYWQLRRQPS